MKALIIGEAFFPEDFIINDLVKEWKNRGYELEVLTRTPSYPFGKVFKGYKNKLYQQTDFNGIKVHRIPVVPGYHKSVVLKLLNYFSFVFFSSIVGLFIGKKYDRIFVYQTGPLTVALAGVLIKKVYKIPLTIWTQDLWPDTVYAYGFKKRKWLQFFLNKLVYFIYNNTDTILVSCQGFINKLQEYVPNKSIYWIPNWSLVPYQPTQSISLKGRFNFTFAGNIGKVQNLENIFLGFESFVKENPDTYLNIVGDGSNLESLKNLVAAHGIANIDFWGRKPLNEMANFFQASDVLIISLIDEPIFELTIPSKFQTYLETEKPIMGVIKGEVATLINEYFLGFTSASYKLEDIKNTFQKFVELSIKEKEIIKNNSRNLLENKFSKSKLTEKLTSLFWKT